MSNFKIKVGGSCVAPIINSVSLNTDGYLVINYSLSTVNLGSPEYQIATDENFNNIVNYRVGFLYTQEEVTFLLASGYSNLYIRARKHCLQDSTTVPSVWSTVYHWINTTQQVNAPYEFNPVSVVPGNYTTPILDEPEGGNNYSICLTGNGFTANVKIDTEFPQVGTQIFLKDGVTRAIPGNIPSTFGGVADDCNVSGIRWIRFTSSNPAITNKVWDVNPSTGKIIGESTTYNCN